VFSFLSVNDNKIRAIPFEMSALSKLAKLPLSNNPPIVSPPIEMAALSDTHEGCRKVLEYLGYASLFVLCDFIVN
jgi:hypothetical protein